MSNRMFEVRPQEYDRHVVVPDLHGEFEVAQDIIERYHEQDDIGFVFLGDVVDRRTNSSNDDEQGVRKTLEILRDLGNRAILTIANHEWVLHNAMLNRYQGYREAAVDMWLGTNYIGEGFEKNVLVSYGMNPAERNMDTPKVLADRMALLGHLAVLRKAVPYFETDKFIATHAAIHKNTDWDAQKEYLEEVTQDMANGTFWEQPPQWFSFGMAVSSDEVLCTNKVVVSGHAHNLTGRTMTDFIKPERSTASGKRIRLASQLNAPARQNAFIWQDWDGKVIELPRGD